jgi:hypothetical protein
MKDSLRELLEFNILINKNKDKKDFFEENRPALYIEDIEDHFVEKQKESEPKRVIIIDI